MSEAARLPHALCISPADPQAGRWLSLGGRILHFVRHGEGAHQVRAAELAARGIVCRCDEFEARGEPPSACPYWDESLIDAPLTEAGRGRVAGAAAAVGARLVLAAASRRSLETAELAFATAGGTATPPNPPPAPDGAPLPGLPGPAGRGRGDPQDIVPPPEPGRAVPEGRSQRPGTPPILALEELRARVGAHMHSRRRPVRVLRERFPAIDFGAVADDEDRLWRPETEPRASLDARAVRFLRFLFARPERSIGVVTHFTLLLTLLQPASDTRCIGRNPERPDDDPAILDCRSSEEADRLRGFLAVGEVRSVVVLPAETRP